MSLEESKAIERQIMSEMNKGNFAIIDKLFADSFIYHGPFGTELTGKEDFKKFAADFIAAFPDFHMTIEDMIAEDDKVVSRLKIEGTHKGEFAGIPPTGKKVAVAATLIAQFENGKEVESWDCWDTASLLQQLGAIPPPAE
jgi:steroid delta-isomerase-like uncharacterized protein